MAAVKRFAVAVLLLSLLVFVFLFGQVPALRRGPIGILSRFLRLRVPELLLQTDNLCTGGRCSQGLHQAFDYLIYRNHPLILIFYLILLVAAEAYFLRSAFFRLSTFHQGLAIFSSLAPLFFTYKSVTSTASVITPGNHYQNIRSYPYDHVLYRPGRVCRTCNFLKPARSKHCSVCNACVAKHDHHCVWIMNCVGKNNILHFLCMLLSLSVVLTYGAYLAYSLLSMDLQKSASGHLNGTAKKEHWSTDLTWSRYANWWSWALSQDYGTGGVGLLALLTAPLAWTMFLYHVYLIWAGTTTNESSKWSDWREDIDRGLVYKYVGKGDAPSPIDQEVDPYVDWPIHSNQRLHRSEDGRPPRATSNENGGMSNHSGPGPEPETGASSWTPVYGLHEIENLYDLGFWDNLMDVFRHV